MIFRLICFIINVDFELHPFIVDEFTEDNPIVYGVMRTGERVI